jgi:hypothetical protein
MMMERACGAGGSKRLRIPSLLCQFLSPWSRLFHPEKEEHSPSLLRNRRDAHGRNVLFPVLSFIRDIPIIRLFVFLNGLPHGAA